MIFATSLEFTQELAKTIQENHLYFNMMNHYFWIKSMSTPCTTARHFDVQMKGIS